MAHLNEESAFANTFLAVTPIIKTGQGQTIIAQSTSAQLAWTIEAVAATLIQQIAASQNIDRALTAFLAKALTKVEGQIPQYAGHPSFTGLGDSLRNGGALAYYTHKQVTNNTERRIVRETIRQLRAKDIATVEAGLHNIRMCLP